MLSLAHDGQRLVHRPNFKRRVADRNMGDYHTTYKGPEGQTTQWEDIQVKLGNMAPKAPKHKAPKWEGEQEMRKDTAWLAQRDEDELSEHEDAFDDDREMEELRCGPVLWRKPDRQGVP